MVGQEALLAQGTRPGSNCAQDTPIRTRTSKEFLAGYWIVDVESEQRAIEIAAEASAAPGPGGHHDAISLRSSF